MKRGSRLFFEISEAKQKPEQTAKGRSPVLLENRNNKLLYRYYYYTRLLQYSFNKVIEMLVYEFDLSRITITELVQDRASQLRQIADSQPTIKELEKMFPSYNWKGKPQGRSARKKEVFVLSDSAN
jgi:hypothetical protein